MNVINVCNEETLIKIGFVSPNLKKNTDDTELGQSSDFHCFRTRTRTRKHREGNNAQKQFLLCRKFPFREPAGLSFRATVSGLECVKIVSVYIISKGVLSYQFHVRILLCRTHVCFVTLKKQGM